MTELTDWTDEEHELGHRILVADDSPGLIAIALARCLLQLERIQADAGADKQPGPDCHICGRPIADHPISGGAGSMCTLPPLRPNRRFTAPEALPVGARVRIVELAADDHPEHFVGDIVTVVEETAMPGANCIRQPHAKEYYLASRYRFGGTWVRTVELVEEPQHPRGSEVCACDGMHQRRHIHATECPKADISDFRRELSFARRHAEDAGTRRDAVIAENATLSARVRELETETMTLTSERDTARMGQAEWRAKADQSEALAESIRQQYAGLREVTVARVERMAAAMANGRALLLEIGGDCEESWQQSDKPFECAAQLADALAKLVGYPQFDEETGRYLYPATEPPA